MVKVKRMINISSLLVVLMINNIIYEHDTIQSYAMEKIPTIDEKLSDKVEINSIEKYIEKYIEKQDEEPIVEEIVEETDLYYGLSEEEYNLLCQLVFAEARGESHEGKVAVAQVVLYRAERHGVSVTDIIYAKNQFEPVSNGKINNTPDEATIMAVNQALEGNYVLEYGVEYFYAPKYTNSSAASWFENDLEYVGTIGVHRFFKRK